MRHTIAATIALLALAGSAGAASMQFPLQHPVDAWGELLIAAPPGSSSAFKAVPIAADSSLTLLNITPGTCASPTCGHLAYVNVITNSPATDGTNTLKVFRDGEAVPSVSATIADLAAARDMNSQSTAGLQYYQNHLWTYEANTTQATSRMYSLLNAPFTSSLKVVYNNNSASSITGWFNIGYYVYPSTSVVNWGRYSHLHAVEANGSAAGLGSIQLVNVTSGGPGVLWSLYMFFNVATTGSYEGPIQYQIDGESAPGFTSSGTEDYFGQDFYFDRCSSSQIWIQDKFGCTYANSTAGLSTIVGAYRIHYPNEDAPAWNSSFDLTWFNGLAGFAGPGSATINYLVEYYTSQ
ncbi:MAG: DUF2961 domain-containing protein [Candidatus Binatales bacterium]